MERKEKNMCDDVKVSEDVELYAFTEDASLAIAGLDNSSTGFRIPDEVKAK